MEARIRERRRLIEDALFWEICRRFDPNIFLIEWLPRIIPGKRRKTYKGDSNE
jgi:hypothetical protein